MRVAWIKKKHYYQTGALKSHYLKKKKKTCHHQNTNLSFQSQENITRSKFLLLTQNRIHDQHASGLPFSPWNGQHKRTREKSDKYPNDVRPILARPKLFNKKENRTTQKATQKKHYKTHLKATPKTKQNSFKKEKKNIFCFFSKNQVSPSLHVREFPKAPLSSTHRRP